MGVAGWTTAITCAGQLGLAVWAASRGAKSPLAIPLALLCLCLFGWNFMALGHDVSGEAAWRYLDVSISPFTVPLTLHFIVVFVGARRRLSRFLLLTYVAFAALSLASAAALFVPWARDFAGSWVWAAVYIALAVVPIAATVWLLLRHMKRARNTNEQMQARLVFAALVVGAALGSTELWADVGVRTVRLGNVATFVSTSLLSVVALRFRLLEERPSALAGVVALAIGAVAVVSYLAVFALLAANTAMLVIGTASVTLVLAFEIRRLVSVVSEHRARRKRLELVGRLSAQMAHDLKTPLAALKGTAQFLKEERAQGRSIDTQGEFLDLLVEESDRLARLVEKYRRLATMSLDRAPADVNELVTGVVRRTRGASTVASTVALRTELASELSSCELDWDLMEVCLDNLLLNAREAMPDGGVITVRTERDDRGVRVSVGDTGVGLNPRKIEEVFEEFFTTKTSNSGLGLSFVRRVVEAHGGTVRLSSEEGHGTEVSLCLPLVAR